MLVDLAVVDEQVVGVTTKLNRSLGWLDNAAVDAEEGRRRCCRLDVDWGGRRDGQEELVKDRLEVLLLLAVATDVGAGCFRLLVAAFEQLKVLDKGRDGREADRGPNGLTAGAAVVIAVAVAAAIAADPDGARLERNSECIPVAWASLPTPGQAVSGVAVDDANDSDGVGDRSA
jgi:hypothetical protein